jgi:hypothetical protein
MRLELFERDATAFSSRLGWEHYQHGAGLKPTLDLTRVYDDYRHLFTLETFEELREYDLGEKLGDQYRTFLLGFVAKGYLQDAVRPYTERLAQAEATATLVWGDRELTYRAAPVAWSNEADPDDRHTIYNLWREACAGMNPLRGERVRALREAAPTLGLGDYVELWDQLRGLQLGALAEQMEALLASTADLYRDNLRTFLTNQGIEPGEAWRPDLAHVLRGTDYDELFGAAGLEPTLVRTLRDLGYELAAQTNIELDLESRPAKSPRAFCSPLDIPQMVKLVMRPHGGRQDYETLLHEAGHAEHFANTDPALPFGFKWAGDTSITEGYAFLLQYLATDPVWLRIHLGLDDARTYRYFALFAKLQIVRRYAAKLLYELQLWRAEAPESVAELYSDLLSEHQGVHYFEDEYLSDVDDAFYSAAYLRAWIFEAQLRAFLVREYEEEWFRAPRAGRFVRDLWRDGYRYTADQLVRFMGYERLDPEPLLAELREVLAV